VDLRLQCGACGAVAELDAESLSDTHRPACLRCGGRLRRVGGDEEEDDAEDQRDDAVARRPRGDGEGRAPRGPAPTGLRKTDAGPAGARKGPPARAVEQPEPFDADGFLWRARERERKGDLAGALADCDAALELEPDLAPVWLLRGATRARQGQTAAAATDLERFLALAPDHPQAPRTRAKLAELRGG
jgi:tetratricopeptide (TPR) repeat protein